jgi:hypothetical protein
MMVKLVAVMLVVGVTCKRVGLAAVSAHESVRVEPDVQVVASFSPAPVVGLTTKTLAEFSPAKFSVPLRAHWFVPPLAWIVYST